jgi:hypothetical protein
MIHAVFLSLLAANTPAWVIATSLNVRSEAKATAKLVHVARIAEACELLGPAVKGWVEVSCGSLRGFARAEFLVAEKPTVEGIQKRFDELQAQDDRAGWDERFVAAQRLLALGVAPSVFSEFFPAYFAAQNRLASDGRPLKSIDPWVSPESQDAPAEGNNALDLEVGLPRSNSDLRGKVLPDGTAWFIAGEAWRGNGPWQAFFQLHAVVTPSFAAAMGEKAMKADACPLLAARPGELLCGAGGATCHACKLACAATCNDCRLGCKLANKRKLKSFSDDGPWETCVRACLPSYADCAKSCEAAAPDAGRSGVRP